jgi:hypothetical protein
MSFADWNMRRKLNKFSKQQLLTPSGLCFKRYCASVLNNTLKEDDKIQAYEDEIAYFMDLLKDTMGNTFKKFPMAGRILACAVTYEVLDIFPEDELDY